MVAIAASFNNPPEPLKIDRNLALAHLAALGYKHGDTVFLRFFFPEGDPRKKNDQGRKLEGKFPNLPWNQISQLQAEGRGAYFVVNGHGHADKDINQGRAVFYEHDDLDKDLQRDLWQTLGLPQPSAQVDTGGKSIHSKWRLSEPCTPEQWRELQVDLLEFADGDRKLKNLSRVMRLAGAYHIKPGREPIQSTLILNTGRTYSYEELRAIIPRQQKQESEPNQIRWHEFDQSFQLPVDDLVPLYECLTRADRDLIERGAGEGSRNSSGFALAANLVATSDYLASVQQRYEGDPRQLFEQYAQNCTPPIDNSEMEAIWESANQRTKGTSLPPDAIENCIKSWKWRQVRGGSGDKQLHEQSRQAALSNRHSTKTENPSAPQLETKEQRHARLIKSLEDIEAESRASFREFLYETLAKESGFTKRALKEIWRQESLDKPVQNLDLHDLLLEPPKSKEWVIDGLIELSKVYLLAAQAKTGKTPLIYDWLYSVVTGLAWAEKFPVSAPGRVLCIQSDENIERTKEALLLRGFASKDASGKIQIPHGSVRFISDFSAAQYPKLKKIIQDFKPRLILIDSLSTLASGLPYDQNSPEFATEVVYPLTKMIGGLGNCSCVITHHTNKSPTELSVDRVAGSGRITAAVDEIWALERVDSKNLADSRRYFSWLGGHSCSLGEPFDLQLTLNLEDLTFSLDGQVLDRKAEADAQRLKPVLQGDFQSNKDLILKYLQLRGGAHGWTIQTIGADLNLSPGVTRRDTLKLFTEGAIQRRQLDRLGGKGRPGYLYYWESQGKKSDCADEPVENSPNVGTASDTNKDQPPDIKDQAEVVIFNQTPPDLYSEALVRKAPESFPQAAPTTSKSLLSEGDDQKSSDAIASTQPQPELTDEWLTSGCLQEMSTALEECPDSETLGELRAIWPKHAMNAACKLVKPDTYKRIMSWVLEQNAAAQTSPAASDTRLSPGQRVRVGNHHGSLSTQLTDGRWYIVWDALSPAQRRRFGELPAGAIAPSQIELVEEAT